MKDRASDGDGAGAHGFARLVLVTLGLYPLIGHWAALVAVALALPGLAFHFVLFRVHALSC